VRKRAAAGGVPSSTLRQRRSRKGGKTRRLSREGPAIVGMLGPGSNRRDAYQRGIGNLHERQRKKSGPGQSKRSTPKAAEGKLHSSSAVKLNTLLEKIIEKKEFPETSIREKRRRRGIAFWAQSGVFSDLLAANVKKTPQRALIYTHRPYRRKEKKQRKNLNFSSKTISLGEEGKEVKPTVS